MFLGKLATVFLSMSSSPSTFSVEESKLLTLLQPIYPSLQKVTLLSNPIIQASAVGYKCELEGVDDLPQKVFVKHVDAAKYASTKKDWHDLRRALMYTRTEVRFYNTMQHLECMPVVEYAKYNLDGLMKDEEHVTDDEGTRTNMPSVEECEGKGGLLVLDLIDDKDYYQASPLTLDQCKQCLAACADLHKAAWQDVSLLEKASKELSSPSFALKLRNPKELANIEESWNKFRSNFESEFKQAGIWESTATLATRLKEYAAYISQQLSPAPTDPYCTLVHGDYKAMNSFIPRDPSKHEAILVDFASVGIGNGMADVAMHISHAVLPDDLAAIQPSGKTGEMELLEHYLDALDVKDYPREVALLHYKLAFCDYMRFFVARFYASATPESMAAKRNNPNINNINRYPEAAMAFIKRGEEYLREIEAMRASKETEECVATNGA